MRKDYSKRFWTEAEDAIIREKYPNTDNEILVQLLGRSIDSIYGRAFKFGIQKTEEYIKNAPWVENLKIHGKSYRFVKGQTPPNKGKKMSADVYEKVKGTMFKKGQLPHNAKTDKYERICSKDGYILVRVSPSEFKLKQRIVWEAVNGPIPAGHVLTFKDDNKLNCDLGNLKLITMKENMIRNSIHNYPPEVKSAIQLLGKLNRKIREKQND